MKKKHKITLNDLLKIIKMGIKKHKIENNKLKILKNMNNNENKTEKKDFEMIKPIEFKRILKLYGMPQIEYCKLRGKSRSWWTSVLDKRDYLLYVDIEAFIKDAGEDTFNILLAEVRRKYPQKIAQKQNKEAEE